MSAVRRIHLTRQEDAAIRERNEKAAQAADCPALAEAIRQHNTDRDYQAAQNQWGWTK